LNRVETFYTDLLIKDRRTDTPWWNFSDAVLTVPEHVSFCYNARLYIVYTDIVSDFRLPPRSSWELRSSGLLRGD